MEIFLIIILIILLTPYLLRLVFPFLLRWLIRKTQANQQQEKKPKEGDVNIRINQKPNSSKSNDLGEYVDFEEIDDK